MGTLDRFKGAQDAGTTALIEMVRALRKAREKRAGMFPGGLLGDPAWDMMLELMEAGLAGRRVTISSLGLAAEVPPTTALRWIGILVQSGMLVRENDPDDRRRVFVALSDDASERFRAYLGTIERPGPAVD